VTIEKPILFSGPMVRAILDGRKTQTRRICKPLIGARAVEDVYHRPDGLFIGLHLPVGRGVGITPPFPAPYSPEDRLWVRETWAKTTNVDGQTNWPARPHKTTMENDDDDQAFEAVIYRADGDWEWCDGDGFSSGRSYWRPSIHMPREFSRITLEITEVRVERLQDISEEDAKAEGMFFTDYGRRCGHLGGGWVEYDPEACPAPIEHHAQHPGWAWKETRGHDECLHSAKWAFGNLWNHINGENAWAANPFVWCISFRRI
jgi:hypothetical protein